MLITYLTALSLSLDCSLALDCFLAHSSRRVTMCYALQETSQHVQCIVGNESRMCVPVGSSTRICATVVYFWAAYGYGRIVDSNPCSGWDPARVCEVFASLLFYRRWNYGRNYLWGSTIVFCFFTIKESWRSLKYINLKICFYFSRLELQWQFGLSKKHGTVRSWITIMDVNIQNMMLLNCHWRWVHFT